MGCDRRNSQCYKGRSRNCGCDDIGRNARKSHAENHTRYHCKHQGEHQVLAANLDDSARHVEGKTGDTAHAYDNSDAGTGNGNRYGRLGARHHGVDNIIQAHPRVRTQLCNNNCEDNGIECSHNYRLTAEEQHVNQENQRNRQMAVFLHDLAYLGELILRRPLHSHFLSAHLDLEQDSNIVNDGRNDC